MRKISRKKLKEILYDQAEYAKSYHREGVSADLSGADLNGAYLRRLDLSEADLSEANLSEANLISTDLGNADLHNADLRKADLSWADLSFADLRGADLRGANLYAAHLSGAHLGEANLRGALCGATLFTAVDLSDTRGLGSIWHDGPSTVGVDTLFISKGRIPRAFLEGCGVPEMVIDYVPSLVNSLDLYPYYDCFISYAEPDDTFSRKLYEDLKTRKIRCWRWREDAILGRSMRGEIDQAVRKYDKLVVICSRDSLDRRPVQHEIELALQEEERRRGEVLFPIAIDDYLLHEWDHALKGHLVKKVVGNFPKSGRGKAYDEALERLVEGLKRDLVKKDG